MKHKPPKPKLVFPPSRALSRLYSVMGFLIIASTNERQRDTCSGPPLVPNSFSQILAKQSMVRRAQKETFTGRIKPSPGTLAFKKRPVVLLKKPKHPRKTKSFTDIVMLFVSVSFPRCPQRLPSPPCLVPLRLPPPLPNPLPSPRTISFTFYITRAAVVKHLNSFPAVIRQNV